MLKYLYIFHKSYNGSGSVLLYLTTPTSETQRAKVQIKIFQKFQTFKTFDAGNNFTNSGSITLSKFYLQDNFSRSNNLHLQTSSNQRKKTKI